MAAIQPRDRGAHRFVSARLNRFEEQLIITMAKREKLTTSQMVRECILREAVRPLFGEPPISEVMVDAE